MTTPSPRRSAARQDAGDGAAAPRRRAGTGGRVAAALSAAGAAALVAGVLTAATTSAAPGLPGGVPVARGAASVAVPAGTASLVCPGSPLAVSGQAASRPASAAAGLVLPADAGALGARSLALRPDPVVAAPAGTAKPSPSPSARAAKPAPAVQTTGTTTGGVLQARQAQAVAGRGTLLSFAPHPGSSAQLAGATTSVATGGDLRGLSAPACTTPASSSWLVGGTTGVGRSVRLVVADPGATATTVDVTVLTTSGPQRPAALQGLALAPGEQRSVLLEGAVTPPGPLAVQVRSSAGAVAAWLTEQVLTGLVPGGTDVVVAGAAPARHQVVPGVLVEPGGTPVLRLASTGSTPVVARYAVLSADGAHVPAGSSPAVVVPAGAVVDVPLPGLPSGSAAVVVDADGPVLAAATTTTAPDPGAAGDLAWTTAAPALDGSTLLALPPAPSTGTAATPAAHLVLVAPATGGPGAAVDVRVVDAAGSTSAPTRVPVAAGTTASVDVARLTGAGAAGGPARALLVAPAGSGPAVVAALQLQLPATDGGGELLSVHPVMPAPQGAARVQVVLPAGS